MAKARFEYHYHGKDRSVEDINRRAKQSSGLFDSIIIPDITTLKVGEGENTVRILPPTWEDTGKWGDSWEIQIYIHYGVGPDNGQYLCLDKMLGEPCPICEVRRDAADEDERDALRPSWRALAWVIDRDNETAGPQVWSLPATLFREINARSIDKKNNTPILIDDPEEGYDIIFNREGTGPKRTKYIGVEVVRDPRPLHDDQKLQDRWLTYIQEHPLPDILNFMDADLIEKTLSGKAARKPRDEADAEEGAGEADHHRRASRRPAREPVEEASEEKDEGTSARTSRRPSRRSEPAEEGEAESPPSGRTGRRSGREESVEEEVEPDPPPRRTARRPVAEPEPEEEEAGEPDPPPSRAARAGLERLRPGKR